MPLYDAVLAAAAAMFVVAASLIGRSIIRHRDTAGGREPSGLREDVRLELLWWALPTILGIVLFVLTAR